MTTTISKLRSQTRLHVPRLSCEVVGQTIDSTRQRHARASIIELTLPTEHVLLGSERPYGYVPAEHIVDDAQPWNWFDEMLFERGNRPWIVLTTAATTAIATGQAYDPAGYDLAGYWQEAGDVKGAPVSRQAVGKLHGRLPAPEPDEEVELCIRIQPKRLRKVTGRITRRIRRKPRPILD
jgi:hypothetical protein